MPSLPSSPNLEHLKHQAKTFLKAVRTGEGAATARLQIYLPGSGRTESPIQLADAQFVLAREYGFPSWPKLKRHVEATTEAQNLEPAEQTRGSGVRQVFLQALASELLNWAGQADTSALGKRFAVMPLRDILAVRHELHTTDTVRAVVAGLLEGLQHPQPRVRFDCANALDHLADERCAAPLRELLSDPVPRVRRAALHSLSCDACKLTPLEPGADLAPTLIRMALYDPSVRVRRSAVPMLESHCQDARVEQAIEQLSRDGDPIIQREASQILRRQMVLTPAPRTPAVSETPPEASRWRPA